MVNITSQDIYGVSIVSLNMDNNGPALSTRSNLGPWSAPVARVHPWTVQQHRYLPDVGRYRTLVMRAME